MNLKNNSISVETETKVTTKSSWNSSAGSKIAKQKWRKANKKRAWVVQAINSAKRRAEKKALPFDLTGKYLFSVTPDTCPVFGTEFVFIGNGRLREYSATLDRLDPAKGYTRDNVMVISHKANMVKSACGSADIQKVADWLRNLGY